MGANVIGPARLELSRQAYKLAIARITYTTISERLNISRGLVAKLVSEEQERREDETQDNERQLAIDTYESVIRHAWSELTSGNLAANSLNRSGLLNTIVAAQSKIDEITGIRAPKDFRSTFTHEYIDLHGATEETVKELEALLAQEAYNEEES